MKREIKFRGLRTDGKGWVYGVPISISQIEEEPEDSINVSCIVTGCDWNGVFGFMPIPNELVIEVIPESVGQFTGLKDNNGVYIYEGDLMKYGKESFTVVFEPKYGYVAEFTKTNTNICIPIYKFEIIGNIHQN